MLKVIEIYNIRLRYSNLFLRFCKMLLIMVLNKMSTNYIFSKKIYKMLKVIEIINYTLRYSKYILKGFSKCC